MKYTIEDLKNNKIVVHTPSQAKFNKLIEVLNKIEKFSFKKDMYVDYKKLTCIYYTWGSFEYDDVEGCKENGYKIITIDDIDFEGENSIVKEEHSDRIKGAMKNPGVLDIKKLKEVSERLKNKPMDELITMTTDEARRYRIQRKIEDVAKNKDIYKWFLFETLEDYLKGGQYRSKEFDHKDIVRGIGEEDLKFFFNIETTMTMKEAIEQGLDFEFEGNNYSIVGGNACRVSAYRSWLETVEDKDVKIIRDK